MPINRCWDCPERHKVSDGYYCGRYSFRVSEDSIPLPNCKVASGEAKPVGWRDREKTTQKPRAEIESED